MIVVFLLLIYTSYAIIVPLSSGGDIGEGAGTMAAPRGGSTGEGIPNNGACIVRPKKDPVSEPVSISNESIIFWTVAKLLENASASERYSIK